jgi:AcrR family transcriptional regulator
MKKKTSRVRQNTAVAPVRRRKRGRPSADRGMVGRDAIVASARLLVERLPPHEVSIALIAREARVDPALVRYYFKDREVLLLAVVESILADWAAHPAPDLPPVAQIEEHLANMLRFSRSVRSMQRLMVEECAGAKSTAVRARVQQLGANAVQALSGLLRSDAGGKDPSPDALFLHVAMIGLCEFFAAAQPLIQPLVPEGMSEAELARRYEQFIHDLVLHGIGKRLRPARRRR